MRRRRFRPCCGSVSGGGEGPSSITVIAVASFGSPGALKPVAPICRVLSTGLPPAPFCESDVSSSTVGLPPSPSTNCSAIALCARKSLHPSTAQTLRHPYWRPYPRGRDLNSDDPSLSTPSGYLVASTFPSPGCLFWSSLPHTARTEQWQWQWQWRCQ